MSGDTPPALAKVSSTASLLNSVTPSSKPASADNEDIGSSTV